MPSLFRKALGKRENTVQTGEMGLIRLTTMFAGEWFHPTGRCARPMRPMRRIKWALS
jgi:hypothetical protein